MHPPSKFIYWSKLLSKFVSIQLVVQFLTFGSGIFVIRTLDQQQYAYYTIAGTMQATMTIIADMGISFGVSSIGGEVWNDRYRFGQLINTALKLRYLLGVISITFVTPISLWMLMKNEASFLEAIVITVIVLIGFNFQLTMGVLIVVPRLHSQINQVQNLDLVLNITRVIGLILAFFTSINAATYTLAATISLALQRILLGRISIKNIDSKAPLNEEYQSKIIKIIKQSAPNTIFFCFEGQITVWLISIFGTTDKIAEIGALGRLGLIFTIIGSVMTSIVLPSFARCQILTLLKRRYFQILGINGVLALFLVGLTFLFPNQILWIIGSKYAHLKPELMLIMISSGFYFLANTMWAMNSTKAWITKIWLYIPATMVFQVLGLVFLDVSTVRGVLIFKMASLIPGFMIQSYMTYIGFKSYKTA